MALEERVARVEERVGVVDQKVDQVRHAVGLNGDLTPEATEEARKMWDDLRVVVKNSREQAELRNSYAQVRDDLGHRLRFLVHPWGFIKWVAVALGGAMTWRLAGALHLTIHTPWGVIAL